MAKDIISIKDIFETLTRFKKLVLKKWLFIIISVTVFVGTAVLVDYILKIKYKAKIIFVLSETNQSTMSGGLGIGSLSGIASQFGLTSARWLYHF